MRTSQPRKELLAFFARQEARARSERRVARREEKMRVKPLPPAPACQLMGDERQGAFLIPHAGEQLKVIASDGSDWEVVGLAPPAFEHVSVSLETRTPTWEEMEFVRSLFWKDEETVIQLHVPRRDHINFHPFCLHMWKPIGVSIPLPPAATVGPRHQVPYHKV